MIGDLSSLWADYGSIAFMVIGLTIINITLFKFVMTLLNRVLDENKQLDHEFKEYLKEEAEKNREIIRNNITMNEKFIESIIELNKTMARSKDNMERQNKILQEWLEEKRRQLRR